MARKSNYTLKKRQKDIKRKKKAKEKLDRRQGKNNPAINDVEGQEDSN